LDPAPDRYGPPLHPPSNGNKGGGGVKAEVTKRAITMATRVVSDDDGNGNIGKSNGGSNEGGRQAITRAIAATMTMVGNDEGNGNGDKGGAMKRVRVTR
jgi:hypothetical protein